MTRRYLTTRQLAQRYGRKSLVWVWRRRKSDPAFPRPVVIVGHNYFDEQQLDEYDDAHRAVASAIGAVRLEETAGA
jgi:hypothetical protein